MDKALQVHAGEVYYMEFHGSQTVQNGWRPGIILQNEMGNRFSPNVIAIPLTSSLKKLDMPTHVLLYAHKTGLQLDSIALCENPECVPKSKIGTYITKLPRDSLEEVASAYLLATSAIAMVEPERLLGLWQQATAMNSRFRKGVTHV